MPQNYEERLQIPILGNETTVFKTKAGKHLATGYARIVIGDRGPYIEFHMNNMKLDNFSMPEEEKKRILDPIYYYLEYRSNDESNVKIYFQKKKVDYADYQIGMFYISPFDLLANDKVIIEKLKRSKKDG